MFRSFFMTRRWFLWSIPGGALILFSTWYKVELDVKINEWFGEFYNLIQKALSKPDTITMDEYMGQLSTFGYIAGLYVVIAVATDFFIKHYVFRWRNAMNDYYAAHWHTVRHIEGASQRIQEDTMRFARMVEGLGVSFMRSLMTLFAFLPILWTLSAQVKELPWIGPVPHALVWVAILLALSGTVLLAAVGIKLPGLEFENQRVEAAYRKELVYGEDDASRAQPPTVAELFENVRKNYFRLYFHYVYFNVTRFLYLQANNIFSLFLMVPSIIAGTITLGLLNQISYAFSQVTSSFQYLVNSWPTIVELLSIYKRLRTFEAAIHGEELPDIDRRYLEREQAGLPPEEQPAA